MGLKESKAKYYLAKYHALSTAAEMIRSHGEEGFSYEDDSFNEEYQRQTGVLYHQLNERSKKFLKKYKELDITVDDSVRDKYGLI